MDRADIQPLLSSKTPPSWLTRLSPPARLRQEMRMAAEFAVFAGATDDAQALQDEACRVAAQGLGVSFAKLLAYQTGRGDFLLQAGTGWRDGLVGHARLDADSGTAAGLAWQTGQSILSNDLAAEGRFRTPALLAEHGIVRSINVVVPGDSDGLGLGGAPFGVLEAESPEPGLFVAQDVHFLQLLAHSLASALGRRAGRTAQDAQSVQSSSHASSLLELHHRVRNDLQGVVVSVAAEARRAAAPTQREGFERINRRVMALAGLYDQLLRGHAEDSVDLGAYLRTLCGKIADAGDFASRMIALIADTRPLTVPADQAVRLAIAVNELVANAAAHAFGPEGPGAIVVRLRSYGANGGGAPVLSVSDNGRGFGGPREGGNGLRVVEGLVRQAGGLLSRQDGNGTCWRIQLPV